jgi:hypothetical protein
MYPICVAASTSPLRILDRHRFITAPVGFEGILKMEGALAKLSNANVLPPTTSPSSSRPQHGGGGGGGGGGGDAPPRRLRCRQQKPQKGVKE